MWNYCLFQVWADMQVPIFILIQVFHAYKKGNPPTIKWSSLLKRIVLPFVAIQGIILSLRLFFSSESTHNVLISSVIGGGTDRAIITFGYTSKSPLSLCGYGR